MTLGACPYMGYLYHNLYCRGSGNPVREIRKYCKRQNYDEDCCETVYFTCDSHGNIEGTAATNTCCRVHRFKPVGIRGWMGEGFLGSHP